MSGLIGWKKQEAVKESQPDDILMAISARRENPFLPSTFLSNLALKASEDLRDKLQELKEVDDLLQLDFPMGIAALISEYFSGEGGISDLLKYVAEGEQDKAEVLVKIHPELLLKKGTVTDLSRREFKEITAFQYAAWALDWHMWRMLLQYLGEAAASQQLRNWNALGTYPHGKQVSWQGLVDAYTPPYASQEDSGYWIQHIGGAQRLLPAHVANEYCHESRDFYPLPDFASDTVKLTRSRISGETDWYDERCGLEWWHYRGNCMVAEPHHYAPNTGVSQDKEAVAALLQTRMTQRMDLEKRLTVTAQLDPVKNGSGDSEALEMENHTLRTSTLRS